MSKRVLIVSCVAAVAIVTGLLTLRRPAPPTIQPLPSYDSPSKAKPGLVLARDIAWRGLGTSEISVVVFGVDGRAVPEAEVELFRAETLGWSAAVERKRTSSNGQIAFSVGAGKYLVVGRKDGKGVGSKVVLKPQAEVRSEVAITLKSAQVLRGRVINSKRDAVANAQVFLTKFDSAANSPSGLEERAVADALGRFQFSSVESGDYELRSDAVGFASSRQLVAIPSLEDVTLILIDSGFLQGFVQNASGEPATGVDVSAVGELGSVNAAKTSATGAYSIELAPRVYRLIAQSLDGTSASLDGLAVTAGQTTSAPTLRLGAGTVVHGKIFTSKGVAISKALVEVVPDGASGGMFNAEASDEGAYKIANVPPGTYLLRANAIGYRGVTKRVGLSAGQDATVDFMMGGGGAVAGYVRDEKGAALDQIVVKGGARNIGESVSAYPRETLTDKNGHYFLDGMVAGPSRVMALKPSATAGVVQRVEVNENDVIAVNFTLPSEGTLRGRVNSPGGQKVVSPTIVKVGLPAASNDFAAISQVPVNPDGTYETQLSAGTYRVNAKRVGSSYGTPNTVVKIVAGEVVTMDFDLPDNSDSNQIIARVEDVDGSPAAGAVAILAARLGDQSMLRQMSVDELGNIRLGTWEELSISEIQISAALHGRSGQIKLSRPHRQATIKLSSSASARVSVVGAQPQDSFQVTLLPAHDQQALPLRGPPVLFFGSPFTLNFLSPVPTTISVQSSGRSGTATVELFPNLTTDVEVTLNVAATVSGRVTDSRGRPLASFLALDGDVAATTKDDGSFQLLGVSTGPHELEVSASQAYREVVKKFTVATGVNQDLGAIIVNGAGAEPGSIGAQFTQSASQVLVAWTLSEGPAEQAGLQLGDQITSFDESPVRDANEANSHVMGTPGAQAAITFIRDRKTRTVLCIRAK